MGGRYFYASLTIDINALVGRLDNIDQRLPHADQQREHVNQKLRFFGQQLELFDLKLELVENVPRQLNHISVELARTANKMKGFVSRQVCRDMINSEVRGTQNTGLTQAVETAIRIEAQQRDMETNWKKAIERLQSQMDKLRITANHMPRAKGDERSGGRLGARHRQPAPSQEPTTASPTQLYDHVLERVKAAEANVEKINGKLEEKDKEIAELRETVSNIIATMRSL